MADRSTLPEEAIVFAVEKGWMKVMPRIAQICSTYQGIVVVEK